MDPINMQPSILDTIADYISFIQQKITITKERFYSSSRYFFELVGVLTLLYFFSQLPLLLFRGISQIFAIVSWLPSKTIEISLPNIKNYYILFPLFCLCLFSSSVIAKLLYKNSGKRRLSNLTFIIFFLLQSLFILLPIATSIQEHRKLSANSIDVEQTTNNEIKKIINFEEELSSSFGQDSNIESYIENEPDISVTNLYVSSNEEQENHSIDSAQQFSSNILENSSQFIKKKAEQIREIGKRIRSVIFNRNWLDNAWSMSHKTILSFRHLFSLSTKPLPQYNVNSIYTAFTDLNCYDYTKSLYRYKQKYIYFLNKYRRQSPFPIYLSVIKSNGPICYPNYPNSTCAIRTNLKHQLFRFIRFWLIISLPIIISIVIYKHLQYRQQFNRSSKKINDLPSQKVSSNIMNKNYPLDKKIENKLDLWLKQEKNNGYQSISQSCRIAINRTFSKRYVSKSI